MADYDDASGSDSVGAGDGTCTWNSDLIAIVTVLEMLKGMRIAGSEW